MDFVDRMKTLPLLLAIPAILAGGTSASNVTVLASPKASVYGRAVSLTASVAPAFATGEVTFYDGTSVLGTSHVSNGMAGLTTSLLATGSHSIKAYYAGDSTYAPSTSQTVAQTVNALSSTTFGLPVNYSIGGYENGPSSSAIGDFNGDGIADLAVAAEQLVILLGNGDGTFQPPVRYNDGAGPDTDAYAVAVGDFNADGKSDLAVLDYGYGSVSIFLGNGDGTFGKPSSYATGGEFDSARAFAIADFNNDGKPDIVGGGYGGAYVLLGNGDGTFQSPLNVGPGRQFYVAVADFNGDGNADLALTGSLIGNFISVLLGNGDGTFQAAIDTNVSVASVITAGDLNGDGKPDMAFPSGNGVGVLFGRGDGTFLPEVDYPTPVGATSIALGDANGDGKVDILMSGGNVWVLPGNGDGTFGTPMIYGAGMLGQGEGIWSAITGDFNGDGRTDVAVSPFNGAAVRILLGSAAGPDLAIAKTHAGQFRQGQTGSVYTIVVSNAGNAPTSGMVSVADRLPAGLTATAVDGTGWSCTSSTTPGTLLSTATCTRNDSLPASGVWPAIALTANVAPDAPATIVNTATVSGGGGTNITNNTASDSANLLVTPLPGRIINVADPSMSALAPGSLASLSGSHLAYGTAQVSSAPFPTTLANVTVTVNGILAPLQLVSPGQIIFQIPYETNDTQYAAVIVADEAGSSAPDGLAMAAASPGIFTGLTRNSDSTANSANHPAAPGSAITVFFTGLGAVAPAVADGVGAPGSPLSIPAQPVTASLGGSSATIVSVGLSPGMVGVAQAAIAVPAGLAPGIYSVVISVNSISTVPVTVYVGGPAPVISSVVPSVAPAAGSMATIAINGTNFGGGTIVSFRAPGGTVTTLTPSSALSGRLILTIPQTLFSVAGTAQISVTNGLGAQSNSVPFYITPFTITAVTPDSAPTGSGDTAVTVSGQNLTTATSLLFTPTAGAPVSLPLTSIQTAQVQATIPTALLASAGTARIVLANDAAAVSNALFFTIAPSLPSTTTSLMSSANPSVFGRPVTLTATVAPATAAGLVTFYDGEIVLGSSPLANGSASFTTSLPGADARSLRARFSGGPAGGPSSSPVLAQTVNTVPDYGFLAPASYPLGGPYAAADFNGDGKADLVASNLVAANIPNIAYVIGGVSILLGKGDGTFQDPINTGLSAGVTSVAAGDFNRDGKADLAVTNSLGIDVLLGNGDGTFQPAIHTAAIAGAVTVGDFNSDGKPDLAVTDDFLGGVDIFIGNGDGTFQPDLFYATGSARYMVTGDFNGDGITDLAVSNVSGISLLTGRGDGTFEPPKSTGMGSGFVIAAGDFNGDGKLDLAGGGVNSVFVLPGKGDGTFASPTSYVYGGYPNFGVTVSLATADVNGDGKVDLVFGEYFGAITSCLPNCYNTIGALLGKGDGTFQPPTGFAILNEPDAIVVADFNGDGRQDLATTGVDILLGTSGLSTQTVLFSPRSDIDLTTGAVNFQATASSGLPVFFDSNTPNVCTVSGGSGSILAPGKCSITATQPGNAVYAAASTTQSFTVHAPGVGPAITQGGIDALFSSSNRIQPGSWVSIYGTNLAATTATWTGDFPTSLGGTSVAINGRSAYLWYVSPTQINLQAPDDTTTGSVGVTVTNAGGSWTSVALLEPVAPSFSLLDATHVAAIILRSDGSGAYGGGTYDIAGPAGTSLGYRTVPAKQGEVVTLFGVGFGPTSPQVHSGQAFSGAAATTNQVQVTIGGTTVTPLFAGLSSAGLYQINVTVPAGTGTGDTAITAIVGGVQTQVGAVISLQ